MYNKKEKRPYVKCIIIYIIRMYIFSVYYQSHQFRGNSNPLCIAITMYLETVGSDRPLSLPTAIYQFLTREQQQRQQ